MRSADELDRNDGAKCRPAAASRRRGSVLLEFALVSLVLYLLLAAILEVGRLLYTAQVVQNAARVAARELSLMPLPPDITLEVALDTDAVRERIFDERYLVINLEEPIAADLDALFARLPAVNQALRPAMIVDMPEVGGTRLRLMRYPGALLSAGAENPALVTPIFDTGFRVSIPRVVPDNPTAPQWLSVLEEVESVDNPDPFHINSLQRGLVAVRINYPYQAATMSGFESNSSDPFEPNMANVIPADSPIDVPTSAPPGGRGLLTIDVDPSVPLNNRPYSGQYGLGRQLAFTEEVRPFRKVVSGQAMFRREVFE